MERSAESLTSYVSGEVWVCVFCTTQNLIALTHCSNCELSFKGGEPRSPAAPKTLSEVFTRAGSPVVELGLAVGLLATWKLGDVAAGTNTHGAVGRGRSIWDLERRLNLPSEAAVQRMALPHPSLVHALDGYYAVAHLGGMAALAGWLYLRHRYGYARWRNAVVATTATCFAVQLASVAPPRLVPGLGVLDTAARDGESVYGHAHFANQISSMPSVHMAWALLVAAAVCTVGKSRWRWLSVLHPVLTLAAIIATGNHYWLDAFVAGLLAALLLRLTRQATPT